MKLLGLWTVYDYPLPKGNFIFKVAAGSDGRIWATVLKEELLGRSDGSKVGTTSTSGILLVEQETVTFNQAEKIGLPSQSANLIAADGTGSLWLEMPATLCRFDGEHIDLFRPGERGMPDSWGLVTALLAGNAGEMWLAMVPYGLFHYDGTVWHSITNGSNGLPSGDVIAMTADHDGRIWSATLQNDLTIFAWSDGKKWEKHVTADFYREGLTVQSILFDRNGTLWAGAYDPGGRKRPQIWSLSPTIEHWVKYTSENSDLPDNFYIDCLVADRVGRIWVGPGTIGVIDGREWKRWEMIMPGVEHGPLEQSDLVRAREKGDSRLYLPIGGHITSDKWGKIWTTTTEVAHRRLCVFSETRVA